MTEATFFKRGLIINTSNILFSVAFIWHLNWCVMLVGVAFETSHVVPSV